MTDDERAELALFGGGPCPDWLLIGENGETPVIGLWHSDCGFRYLKVRDGELAAACKRVLARRGVRRFPSEFYCQATAAKEKWAGWERHVATWPWEDCFVAALDEWEAKPSRAAG